MVTLSSQDSGKREAAEQQQVRRQHLLGEGWEGGRELADTSAKMASFDRAPVCPSMTSRTSESLKGMGEAVGGELA